MLKSKPDDHRHDEDGAGQEHIHRILPLQKYRKIDKRALRQPQKGINQRLQCAGSFQGVQVSNRERGGLCKAQPFPY
jgi:hypothetical protein